MSSKLEDALRFVKPMPDHVGRIVPLNDGEIVCSSNNQLYILDRLNGNQVSVHEISKDFTVHPDGRILYIGYEDIGLEKTHGVYSLRSLDLVGGKDQKVCRLGEMSGDFNFVRKKSNLFVAVAESSGKSKIHIFDSSLELKSATSWFSGDITYCLFGGQKMSSDIYISNRKNDFHSIDNDGEINWNMKTSQRVYAGDEDGDMLVIGTDSYTRAFKLNKNKKELPKEVWANCSIGPVRAISIIGENVLVGTENFGGSLYNFDLISGQEKFRHEMTKDFGIWSIAHKNNTLYLGTGIGKKGRVYALDFEALGLNK